MEVDVLVYDTRNPKDFKFEGAYPPPLSAWQERGWRVMDQFERPLREPRTACRRGAGVQSRRGDGCVTEITQ